MLSTDAIDALIADMWAMHLHERTKLDRIYDYTRGRRGIPQVPDGAGQEIKDLAKLSAKNVVSLVRDSFAQNLSVVGYREASAQENDAAWAQWQRNRMDARQAEAHRAALTYGASYVTVTPSDEGPVLRPRSPRQILSVYEDPQIDAWPQYALETWVDTSDAKPRRKALLYDDEFLYPLDLGEVPGTLTDQHVTGSARGMRVESYGEPIAHGAALAGTPVCPVVRFVNDRDADDLIVGEVEPLLVLQQAINSVNFDRLIVSRFGAFPQKVITGWTAEASEVLKASASRVWTFDDPDTKAFTLTAASVEGYNTLLAEMMEHVAMVAQISPSQVTGKMVNVSAEALAAAEANQQRKLAAKRESFGESWEQVLRLSAEMDGDTATAADSSAEVVWRDTEARSFGAVVDGISKLSSAGVPIESLLSMIPGMSQQQIKAIGDGIRGQRANEIVAAVRDAAARASTDPQVTDLASRRTDAVAE
ncbi:phage portal protein [Rhodococcus sp. CSLK01-03]|uniref:Phage portal protein n=1 Tax=Rhodococcus indonesiensis TaxID=3055869 RepID=A0ABT7RM45_9NOCA|nr:phage portal protein [Rhodococcus indonesiensis]MDM7488719.1 phage portal protein [Rhodococcus indonesiensis]